MLCSIIINVSLRHIPDRC